MSAVSINYKPLLICVVMAICLASLQQVASGQDLGEWLHGIECKEDERRVAGVLPECEPTCENPKPICPKLFLMDAVQCFCKTPMVRDTKSKSCVKLSDCRS